jgi:adenine/guanine/hypoxanthine permease
MAEERAAVREEQDRPRSPVDRYFGLTAAGTSLRTEGVAGLTTFLAMAYIICS